MDTFDLRKRTFTGLDPVSIQPKRVRHDGNGYEEDDRDLAARSGCINPEDYKVAWICALPIEMTAAEAMLDEIHDPLPSQSERDSNAYTLGRIGPHNVVVTCLPSGHYGLHNAMRVANDMAWTFPSIKRRLVVGIGGAAPDLEDIRLGDVVVSDQVIQYDVGKSMADGHFQHTSLATRPPRVLLNTVAKLRATHDRLPSQLPKIMDEMLERNPLMDKYRRPRDPDVLYQSSYNHVESSTGTCAACEQQYVRKRAPRETDDPAIHHGIVASGNTVMKDGKLRKETTDKLKVACFEMEAAGLMDDGVGCLVIRGMCDYSDSHKNKNWQPYAAATAAAYAKELLRVLPATAALRAGLDDANEPRQREPSVCEADNWEGSDADRHKMLESLDFEHLESRHSTIKNALNKTCAWFLEDDFYLQWLTPSSYSVHHGFLWISGKPGSGKSTLMKFVYSHTRKAWQTSSNAAVVAFFFNARGTELEKSTVGLYRSLIFQIFTNFPDLYHTLKGHDGLRLAGKTTWEVNKLQSLFRIILENLAHRRLICFIDALDECDDEQIGEMIELFEELGVAAAENGIQFYLCLSSRHYPHVEIQPCLRRTLEDLPGHANDIEKYIATKFRPGDRKSKIGKEITSLLLDKAGGVFMWIVLVIEILNKELQNGRTVTIRRHLEQLPSRLMDLFERIIMKDSTNTQDLLLCIQWILYAKRPLRAEEFYYAMFSGLTQESDVLSAWDPEYVTREHMDLFVVSSSRGLAEVTKTKAAKVQFIHESVRDFLLKENGLRHLVADSSMSMRGKSFEAHSHDQLKRCCQFYIKADFPGRGIAGNETPPYSRNQLRDLLTRKFPFLAYAKDHVWYHADAAQALIPQNNFLGQFNLPRWVECHSAFEIYPIRQFEPDVHMIYVLAELGHVRLLQSVLRLDPAPVERGGGRYKYPLITAAANGHEEAVKLLLSWNEDAVNCEVRDGRTALWYATEQYHTNVVEVLLSAEGIDASRPAPGGMTPLMCAAAGGKDEIVKLLLPWRGQEMNAIQGEHQSALALAFSHGNSRSARLLLSARDIDVNMRDSFGRTLLHNAVLRSSAESTKILLDADKIDVNVCDRNGETPLHLASRNNAVECLQLLLGAAGIDLNRYDQVRKTPLHRAVGLNELEVLRLLLSATGMDVNTRDGAGRTALSLAVSWCLDDAISLLLSMQGIDVNASDELGQTPLIKAAIGDNERSIQSLQILLKAESIDVNLADKLGWTLLSWAAKLGRKGSVKQLIGVKDIIIDWKDKDGRTPLSLAAENYKHSRTIPLLLSMDGVDVNTRDVLGWTPLMWAALRGNDANVEMLVKHKGCNKDLRNSEGETAWDVASGPRAVRTNRIRTMQELLQPS